MNNPILEEKIRQLEKLEKTNDLSHAGVETLKEFRRIKDDAVMLSIDEVRIIYSALQYALINTNDSKLESEMVLLFAKLSVEIERRNND